MTPLVRTIPSEGAVWRTPVRVPIRQAAALPIGIPATAIVAFLLFWVPGPPSLGQFSIAFLLPLAFALWALAAPRSRSALPEAVSGIGGRGLWIELSCIGLVLVFSMLSMLASPEPARAFRVILPMSYGICAIVLFTRIPAVLARQLVGAMMIAGVVVTAAALVAAQVPMARATVMLDYRFKGFFENANQASLAIVAFFPTALALAITAASTRAKALYGSALFVFLVALIMGTKTGLGIALFSTALVAVYHSARSGSVSRSFLSVTLVLLLIVAVVPIGLWVLSWANPISFNKVTTVITGGFWDYQSIHSRNVLWDESIRLGMAHPLVGAGAGSKVLDKSHSHNMVLDYFRGMGVAGAAAAIVLLVVTACRAFGLFVSTLANGRADRSRDTVTVAFYLGALGFLIGNQISDSFSPSTAYAFWVVYIAAYMSNMKQGWQPGSGGRFKEIHPGIRTSTWAPGLRPRTLFEGQMMFPRQPWLIGGECAEVRAGRAPPKLP